MTVYTTDSLSDFWWTEFVDCHEFAFVFHSAPWFKAIYQIYGYRFVVHTITLFFSFLSNGIVFCQVKSWLTGWRMVSVSFFDHCEPLLDSTGSAIVIVEELKKVVDLGKWKYVEFWPRSEMLVFEGVVKVSACYLYMLDLRSVADELLWYTHKIVIQGPIKRAEREGIVYERGNLERLLYAFYRLMVQIRWRHQLPSQFIEWFRNLAVCMGDWLQIWVAFKDGDAIVSIVILQYKDVAVYKYAAFDSRFHNLGGISFLLWKVIVEAQVDGMRCMDFGRSDIDNLGLITFKNRWGAKFLDLIYLRWFRKSILVAT